MKLDCKHCTHYTEPMCYSHRKYYAEACEQYESKDNESQVSNDPVNHPDHYTHGGMECIDEMVAVFGRYAVMNFCLCNVWKYRKRAMFKNGEEDLKKADWYMNKYVELQNEKE